MKVLTFSIWHSIQMVGLTFWLCVLLKWRAIKARLFKQPNIRTPKQPQMDRHPKHPSSVLPHPNHPITRESHTPGASETMTHQLTVFYHLVANGCVRHWHARRKLYVITIRLLAIVGIAIAILFPEMAYSSTRIKDITTIQGIRSNPLVGYGLVVGLEGTGDGKATFTQQSFKSMLHEFGISIPPGTSVDIKNVAAVALSANLPPFAAVGQKIDVTVSSIGSAKSLKSGTLLMSPLKGADGKVYAVAQGNLVVSGLGAEGKDGSKISINTTSVGRVPNGATVERTVPSPFLHGNAMIFNLQQADFTTAKRIADAVNKTIGPNTAQALNANTVQVSTPKEASQRVNFISLVENIRVEPAEMRAKIVVNARTGTIIVGENVQVRPAAISHGNLTVTITENPTVSQPEPLSDGKTEVVPSSTIQISEGPKRMFMFQGATSLRDLVAAVNSVGAAPGDLMALLEALKEMGAIQAEIVVI